MTKKKSYLKTRIAIGIDFKKNNPMATIVEDFTLNLQKKSLNNSTFIRLFKNGNISGLECLQNLK